MSGQSAALSYEGGKWGTENLNTRFPFPTLPAVCGIHRVQREANKKILFLNHVLNVLKNKRIKQIYKLVCIIIVNDA